MQARENKLTSSIGKGKEDSPEEKFPPTTTISVKKQGHSFQELTMLEGTIGA